MLFLFYLCLQAAQAALLGALDGLPKLVQPLALGLPQRWDYYADAAPPRWGWYPVGS